jgi:hypothetical protein
MRRLDLLALTLVLAGCAASPTTAATTTTAKKLEPIAWQLLQGAQSLRRWIWTVALVALALLVIVLFAPSP